VLLVRADEVIEWDTGLLSCQLLLQEGFHQGHGYGPDSDRPY